MSDEQRADESVEYEAPAVEDLDTTEGPAVTAAGESRQ
jgi:hypothetical protein